MKTADRARGKWRGILMQLGIDQRFLTGKHGPCPFCEGRDRFRWDNDKGNGTFICSACGAGDGIEFLKRANGWDFRTAAQEVDKIVGGVRLEPVKPERDEAQFREMRADLWAASRRIITGDPVWNYLSGRDVLPASIPSCLRFAPVCRAPDGITRPAMVALVSNPDGTAQTLHRTYLGLDGKADMPDPRAIMPGKHENGTAVRLFPLHGARLGIAEGIETALAASKLFNMPVWAALNAGKLEGWVPPAGVNEVVVFGDCDASYTGQHAAFALARRLVNRHRIAVDVRIPNTIGKDWADAA